jgi:glycine hydroxymethyltransferase
MPKLKKQDPQIAKLIELETERQKTSLEMIPSENHSSPAVREALGSLLTDKYAEGYPGKRYYAGLKYYDILEDLCRDRAKKLFKVAHVNVQPYSGSPANAAVYMAVCEPGDTIMGMALPMGGHLTHGWKVNFSAKFYNSVQYGVDEKTSLLDYGAIEKMAKENKPKLMWVGATAYPRIFDWKKLGDIADSVGAYLAADIAHIAGLVAGGAHPSPAPYVHIISTTTHKTLRGPRGGIIMVTQKGIEKDPDLPKKIDKAIFPGLQGGPHMHQVAAIAVCLKEASTPAFKKYAHQIVKNAKALAAALKKHGFNLVSGGTENHLILVDLRNKNISGPEAQDLLEAAGITINKNTIPFDPAPPFKPSGIRMGTPAITTRGMKEKEMEKIAGWINEVISSPRPEGARLATAAKSVKKVREEIRNFCKKFPLPK